MKDVQFVIMGGHGSHNVDFPFPLANADSKLKKTRNHNLYLFNEYSP